MSKFTILFLLLFLVPTFGLEFGGIFVNLVALFIGIIFILFKNEIRSYFSSLIISLVFIILTFLLLLSGVFDAWNGDLVFAAIFSLIRPLLIWTIVTASFVFWMRAGYILGSWNRFIDVSFYLFVLIVFSELVFPDIGVIFDFLYGSRNTKLTGPLGTSYYMGYFVFFISVHYLFLFRAKKNKIIFIKFIISSLIVFLADSKPPLVLLALILPFIFFSSKFFFKITFIYITLMFVFLSRINQEVITEFLSGLNLDSYNVTSLIRILNDAEGAGSYSVRQEQIDFAISKSAGNFGFGVGLGREMLLESWISYYGYRYGIIGLFIYMFLWIYLFLNLIIKSLRVSPQLKPSFIGLGLWYLSQPILLLSGGMNESGLSGLFSSIVLGYTIALLNRVNGLGKKNTTSYVRNIRFS